MFEHLFWARCSPHHSLSGQRQVCERSSDSPEHTGPVSPILKQFVVSKTSGCVLSRTGLFVHASERACSHMPQNGPVRTCLRTGLFAHASEQTQCAHARRGAQGAKFTTASAQAVGSMNRGLIHHRMVSAKRPDGQCFRYRSPKGAWKLRCVLGADASCPGSNQALK